MGIMYDATASGGNAERRRAPRQDFHDLPDVYNPPRRRMHPMLLSGFLFIGVSAAFYGAESMLPPDYKPSHFIGGYDQAIAQAKVTGELTARIGYDSRLKLIETQAVQWQETCRAQLHNWTNYYQAAYARANAGYQLAASIQQQYTANRFATAQASVGGEVGVANMATTFGYLFALVDPETGQKALDLAESARVAALSKLDDAARTGVTVSSEGWNAGLPDPATVQPPVKCELPTALVTSQPSKEG